MGVADGDPEGRGEAVSLREILDRIVFERDTRRAIRYFRKVSDRADKLRMPAKQKRSLFKSFLRAAGFKKIRIKERD